MGRLVTSLFVVSSVILLAFPCIKSATIHVPADQPTIQAGIDAASDGDTVLVAPGMYRGAGNRDIDPGGKVIVIQSEAGPDSTVIDCEATAEDRHRGFYVHSNEDSTTVIVGFTIKNGIGTPLLPSIFGGGQAETGGGITIVGASPRVVRVRIEGLRPVNNDVAGCAVAVKDSRAKFLQCEFLRNGRAGSAIYISGGAIYAEQSVISVDSCVLLDNSASYGGAVLGFYSTISISNCVLARNAGLYGGTFTADNCQIDITQSVVAYSLRDQLSRFFVSSLAVQNTNLYGNVGGDFVDSFAVFENANGNFSANPQFCALNTGSVSVFDSSPLLPQNNNAGVLIGNVVAGCTASRRNWYISPDGSGDAMTIQAALDSTSPGDTIFLAPGTYRGTGNRDLDFGGKDVVLISNAGPAATVIDCEGSYDEGHRGLLFITGETQASQVSGITICGGVAPSGDLAPYSASLAAEMGGGIICVGASPVIEDCRIIGNEANELFFDDNDARSGGTGGGIAAERSELIVRGSEIRGNEAAYGAGLFFDRCSPTIESTLITENRGVGYFGWLWGDESHGGGVYATNSAVEIRDSRIVQNYIHGGGGGFPPIQRPGLGAGIFVIGTEAGPSLLQNCTISDNGAYLRTDLPTPTWAASVFPAYCTSILDLRPGNTMDIAYSIILGPVAGIPTFNCSNLSEWSDNIIDQLGVNDNFSADPMFCSDYSLYDESPCAAEHSPCGMLVGALPVMCAPACGNINNDLGSIDIADLTYLVAYAFREGPPIAHPEYADVNGSGEVNIADVIYMVNYFFRNGPAPVCQ